ncbi:hypothetical protein HELRODRAFT_193153 [Helobdella robusta]|uniref:Fibronectin type-III domain-containing protein n=1 Tax=Helobdella robusta TaxID=6412 RepID=T1FUN9_HELRO|nr:hypothetical protein HELRODRAFT_193153 [Helobdella robusta]ESN97947.1 hypothetical protein HELRODRAFT_193153 [Helobdella robusta]
MTTASFHYIKFTDEELFVNRCALRSMKREEQAGPNFHYKVSYKRLRGHGIDDDDDDDDVSDDEVVQQIFDLNANNLSVPNVGVYRAFEIYVLAVNEKGSAHNVKKIIGYSGQGKPKVVPKNLKLLEHTLTWKNATFEWDPVVDDVSLIQGYLTGYKIHYWRTDHPNDVRTVYVSVRPWIPCQQVHKRKRHNRNIRGNGRNGKKVNGTVTNLWPDATINAAVMVVNGGGAGDLSDPISFKTPEGDLKVVERGSDHLKIRWSPPKDSNGNLTGFEIHYKQGGRSSINFENRWVLRSALNFASDGEVVREVGREFQRKGPVKAKADLAKDCLTRVKKKREDDRKPGRLAPPSMESKKEVLINDTNKLEKKLMDLKPGKPYLITVYGTTKAGRGSENFIEDRTRPEAAPTPPIMGPIEIGDDYINVSWTPTDDPDDPNQNPGSTFAVEYKPTDPDKADDDASSSDQGPGLGGGKPSEDDDDDTYDDDDDGDEDDDSDGGNDDDHEKSPDDQKPTGVLSGFDKIKTTKKPSGSIDDLDSEDYRDSDDEDKPVGPETRPHDRPKDRDKDAPERSKDDYSGPGGQQPPKDSRPTKDGRPDDKQPGSDSDDDKSDDNDDEDDSRHTHDEGGDDGFGGPVSQKPDGSKKPSTKTEKPDDGTARSDGDSKPDGSSGPDGTGRPDDSGKPDGSSGKDGSDGRPGGGDSDPKRPSDKPGGDDKETGNPEDSDGKQAGAGKIGDTEGPDGDGGDGRPKKQPGDKPRKPVEDENIKRPVDRFPSDDHDHPRREHPRTDDDDFVENEKLGPHVVGPGPGSQDGQDRPRSDNYRPDDEGVGRPGGAGRPGGGNDKGILHPKTTPKVPKKKGQKKGKKKGTWKRTIPESENNWINVTDLKPGATYDVRIVAKNKGGKEAKTNATKIVVIPETKSNF